MASNAVGLSTAMSQAQSQSSSSSSTQSTDTGSDDAFTSSAYNVSIGEDSGSDSGTYDSSGKVGGQIITSTLNTLNSKPYSSGGNMSNSYNLSQSVLGAVYA
jgi:hypothetical protein